jgi:tetratricopeptide (TPR) repeat protein
MRRLSRVSTLALPLIAVVLLPAATNVATGALPAGWKPYLWVAWPLAGLLVVPVVIAEVRRHGHGSRTVADGVIADMSVGEAVWNIPPMLRTFTGRESVLGHIGRMMGGRGGGAVVLTGWAGVGKTQAAVAYAAAHRAEFEVGWWVASESRLAVMASLAQLADRLRVGDEDQEVAARRVLQALGGRTRWLLVFDNVAEEHDVVGLLPAGSGQVLITSRDPGLARLGTVVEVEPFDSAVAVRFLLVRTGSTDQSAAAELAAELGGLPLALEQAAAYCASAGVSMAGYLPRYRENRVRLLRQGAPGDRLPVQATLTLAVGRARQRDRVAVQLLSLCSFLAPSAGIPRWLIESDLALLPSPLARAAGDVIGLDTSVAVLVRLSLVQADGELLRVHPVVQDVIRDQITGDRWAQRSRRLVEAWLPVPGADRTAAWTCGRWVRLAAGLIVAALAGDAGDPSKWERWVVALPHATRVVEHATISSVVSVPTAALRHQVGVYLLHRGEYAHARLMLTAAIAERREVLGAAHPDTLTSMNDYARVLVDQGELEAGLQQNEETLAARRDTLGAEHPDTLISMNNRAFVLARLGKLGEARRLHEQTLAIRRRLQGAEHPDVLISMGNLALVLADQGELEPARRLHEQTLAIRRRVLGVEHPYVLNSMNNLAIVLTDQGELEQARRLHEQTLAIRQRLLGPEHPDTLMSTNNHAFVLARQGELDLARRLHEGALAARERILGPQHPHTLISMNNLALVLAAQGELEQARRLHERTLAIRRRVLGPEHPYCLHSQNNLALVLTAQGELQQARSLHEQTLAVRQRVLGPEHPSTLNSTNNLALTLAAQGELEQARRLHEQTLAIRQRVLGAAHPYTLNSATNLAFVLAGLGLAEDAKGLAPVYADGLLCAEPT